MDLDKVINNLDSQSYEVIEQISQDCSKEILYGFLDKTMKIEEKKEFFDKCSIIVNEFKKRLAQRHEQHLKDVDLAHCKYCFDIITCWLENKKPDKLPKYPKYLLSFDSPLFVTWKYTQTQKLRGCIGSFSIDKIEKQLPIYALQSAFNDKRFKPISILEVPLLTCQVSILVDFEIAEDIMNWEIGKHGIRIEFEHQGTYLPWVAEEQKWTQKQTLEHLVEKAGYNGDIQDIFHKINLTRYQSSKCSLSFEEYTKMK